MTEQEKATASQMFIASHLPIEEVEILDDPKFQERMKTFVKLLLPSEFKQLIQTLTVNHQVARGVTDTPTP